MEQKGRTEQPARVDVGGGCWWEGTCSGGQRGEAQQVRDMVERALSQVQARVSWDSSGVVAYGLPGSEHLVHPPPCGQTKHTEHGRSLFLPSWCCQHGWAGTTVIWVVTRGAALHTPGAIVSVLSSGMFVISLGSSNSPRRTNPTRGSLRAQTPASTVHMVTQ